MLVIYWTVCGSISIGYTGLGYKGYDNSGTEILK
jgi:hypothetical protein